VAVHSVRDSAKAPKNTPAAGEARRPARGLSETERRVLKAILREEEAHPGALPELRRVAAEVLGGDRGRAERTLRKLRGRALLSHCTEGFGFGELSRAGRLAARRLATEAGSKTID